MSYPGPLTEILSGGTKCVLSKKVFNNFGPVFQPENVYSPKTSEFGMSSVGPLHTNWARQSTAQGYWFMRLRAL